MKSGTVLALGSVAALALGAVARSHGSPSLEPHGVLLNPRDPGSVGRVSREVLRGDSRPSLIARIQRGSHRSGTIIAQRVDDFARYLRPEAEIAVRQLGDRVGRVISRAYVVHTAEIESTRSGHGWGQILYRAMAMVAVEEDAALVSHACTSGGITSNDADNMWTRLGRSIVVEQVDMAEREPEIDEDENKMYDGPCFVAWGAPTGRLAHAGSRSGASIDFDRVCAIVDSFYKRPTRVHERDYQSAHAWAKKAGLQVLGLGSDRVVVRIPEGALKIAWYRSDPSNLNEARVWYEAPKNLKRHLVPVLAADPKGAWLVMEYAPSTGQRALPWSVHAAFSRCGVIDLEANNLSDDGRILDYAFVDLTKWTGCVDRVAKRTARKGSLSRSLTLTVADDDAVDRALAAGDEDFVIAQNAHAAVTLIDLVDWWTLDKLDDLDVDEVGYALYALQCAFGDLLDPLPVYRGILRDPSRGVGKHGAVLSARAAPADPGRHWTISSDVAERFADGTHQAQLDFYGNDPKDRPSHGRVLTGSVPLAGIDWRETFERFLKFSLDEDRREQLDPRVAERQVYVPGRVDVVGSYRVRKGRRIPG